MFKKSLILCLALCSYSFCSFSLADENKKIDQVYEHVNTIQKIISKCAKQNITKFEKMTLQKSLEKAKSIIADVDFSKYHPSSKKHTKMLTELQLKKVYASYALQHIIASLEVLLENPLILEPDNEQ